MSIRSCCRVGSNEGGFILISVLVIALLYFGLLELMLLESTEAMRTAQRFRSRSIAHTLAENAAELSAKQVFSTSGQTVYVTDETGTMSAKLTPLPGNRFLIDARGTTAGLIGQTATVKIYGKFHGNSIRIERTEHSQ